MHRFPSSLLIAATPLLVSLAAGCATMAAADRRNLAEVDGRLDSWVGSSAGEVIASWGPPTSQVDDGAQGTMLVWNPELTDASCHSLRPRTYDRGVYRAIRVDTTGQISQWSWRGRYFSTCATQPAVGALEEHRGGRAATVVASGRPAPAPPAPGPDAFAHPPCCKH